MTDPTRAPGVQRIGGNRSRPYQLRVSLTHEQAETLALRWEATGVPPSMLARMALDLEPRDEHAALDWHGAAYAAAENGRCR